MPKRTCYTEVAYLAGLILIAVGVVFMEKSDFGVSMVVAPAYILYRKLNPILPFFSFGMAEYCLQAVLIVILVLVRRRFKISYALTFLTAALYGLILDGCMVLGALLPAGVLWQRIVYFAIGVVGCTVGVAMMFRTYLPPEAYELFVKEMAEQTVTEIHKCKTIYDCASLLVAVVLSLCLFGVGHFVGVKWGTIFCALVNGFIISRFSRLYGRLWVFRDALPWRAFFERRTQG